MPITFVTIDVPGATFGTNANGINNAGQIAGYYTDGSGTQGFLLSGDSFTTLNNPAVGSPPGGHYPPPWASTIQPRLPALSTKVQAAPSSTATGAIRPWPVVGASRAGISGGGSTMPAKSSAIVTSRWELPTGRQAVSST